MSRKDNHSADGPIGGMDTDESTGKPAFDIGYAPYFKTRLEPPLEQAQAVLDQAKAKIYQGITGQLAQVAVDTGRLQQKAAQELAAPIQAAGDLHSRLGNRIASALTQPLFDTAAWGERWGMFPELEPGMIPPGPVLEARAAFQLTELGIPPAPDGRPLVVDPTTFEGLWSEFGREILPLRSFDYDRYTGRLKELEQRFPPGSSYRREFEARLATAEAETPIGIRPQEALIDIRPPTKPSIPLPPPGGEPGPGGGGIVTKPGPRPVIPGGIAPGMGGNLAPNVETLIPGNPGGFPGVYTLPAAKPNGCALYTVQRPIQFQGGQPEQAPAPYWIPAYVEPGYCLEGSFCADGGYFWISYLPLCPESPPTILPPPTAGPAPGQPPTAPGPAPCVAICGMDDLIEALKGDGEKCATWKAWRDAETGECYVQPADREPRHSVDEFILESSDAGALVAAVQEKCGPTEEKPQEKPLPRPAPPDQPVTGCDWILPVSIPGQMAIKNPLGWLFGVVDKEGNPTPWNLEKEKGWFWGPIGRLYAGYLRVFTQKIQDLVWGVVTSQPCLSGANITLISLRAITNFVGLFVGDSLNQVKTPLTQHSNFLCPVGMPDYREATAAWLRNAITEETRDCWTRACGMRDDLWRIVAESQRSRFTPDQLVRLLNRGDITAQEFTGEIRELGYTQETDATRWRQLGKQIPGPSDLVRFMLRDVADPKIVQRFGLDDSFADKFQGDLVRQAAAQGLAPETMRDYWRAHWSIPSPTQLYEMFHRLRNRQAGDDLQVTLEDVRTALEQQDILPYWIDKLLAVSFRPLRLVDTAKAFKQGTIDQEEVRKVYQAIGYSDDDADILVAFQGRDKLDTFARGPWGKRFLAGGINGAQLAQEMTRVGFGQAEQATIRGQLLELLEANRKAKCAGNIRRRQMRGELDKATAQAELLGIGLDGDQAVLLTEAWACERATRGKEFSGAQLCKLYSDGVITGPEFVRRLEAVGWQRDDAVKLYEQCSRDLERKRRAEETRLLRQQEADDERAKRRAESARKALEREQAKEQANGERLAKLNQQRNRVLTDAGANWSKRFGTDLSEAITASRRIYQSIARTTTLPKDGIIKAVHVASRAPAVENESQWLTEALTVAQGQVDTVQSTGTPV